LKKFHQNFNEKPAAKIRGGFLSCAIQLISSQNLKFFAPLFFKKAGGVRGEAPRFFR